MVAGTTLQLDPFANETLQEFQSRDFESAGERGFLCPWNKNNSAGFIWWSQGFFYNVPSAMVHTATSNREIWSRNAFSKLCKHVMWQVCWSVHHPAEVTSSLLWPRKTLRIRNLLKRTRKVSGTGNWKWLPNILADSRAEGSLRQFDNKVMSSIWGPRIISPESKGSFDGTKIFFVLCQRWALAVMGIVGIKIFLPQNTALSNFTASRKLVGKTFQNIF